MSEQANGPPPWRTKLLRARRHIEELRQQIARLKEGGALAVTTEERGRERAVRIVVQGDPPSELSAIIGDVLHNTRSSLDCLAFAACVAGAAAASASLTEDEESVAAFPIEPTEERFIRRSSRCLPHAANEVVQAIRYHQPYYIATQYLNASGDELDREVKHHELTMLNRLSNIDKHRRLHLVGHYPADIYSGVPAGITVKWQWTPGPWSDGSEIGRWLLGEGDEETPIFPHGDVDLILQEHIEQGWTDVEVSDYLTSLVNHVERWVVPTVAVAMEPDATPN